MNLPKDPFMLLSVVNTQLRDKYTSLSELAAAYMTDPNDLVTRLESVGYHYDETHNQFITT